MLKVVVPPLAAAFLLFVAMVVVTVRGPAVRPGGPSSVIGRSGRMWAGHVVGTALGGYAAFLIIVLVFHVWIAGEAEAFGSAVVGGGFLALVTLAVAAAFELMRR